jgi:predicted Rossmann-fold nucleotide-binding protein
MLEIITLKQLQQHTRPVLFLNTNGFYDPLVSLFDHIREHRFAKPSAEQLYTFCPTVQQAFAYLDSYQPTPLEAKWARATKA